jgi:hypothetical protein
MPTPATPHRKLILQAVLTRLKTITRVNGFATDAGRNVIVGEIAVGPDDVDCAIALVPNETAGLGDRTLGKIAETLPLQVSALARVISWADYEDAWMRAEDVLADIKQALEIEDRTLGGVVPNDLRRGSTVTLERGEGQTTLGIAITYEAVYHTGWGVR